MEGSPSRQVCSSVCLMCQRGGPVGPLVLLRSLVLLGHVDVLDQRRVVQDLAEPFVVSVALPLGDDHRGHGVADEVGDRPGLGHEAVDADDERDAHGGDVAEGLQPGGQRHQAGAGDPGCALRHQQQQQEQADLLADGHRRVRRLGDEDRPHRQVDARAVKVERIPGRDGHPDHRPGRPGVLQLSHDPRQHRLRRRGTQYDQQLIFDQPDELQDVETPNKRSDPAEDDQDEQQAGQVEGRHEGRQVAEYPEVEPTHGVGHAAEGADRGRVQHDVHDSKDHLADRVDPGHDPGAVLADRRERDAAEDGEEQHLDDLALGEGTDEGVRDDVQQERSDSARGLLQAAERLLGVCWVGGDVESHSGLDHIDDNEADRQGDQRHGDEVRQGLDPEPTRLGEVAQRGDAHHDRGEDDRGDEHPDEFDEAVGQRLERNREVRRDHSHDRTGNDRQQHPEVQVMVERLTLDARLARSPRDGRSRGGGVSRGFGHGSSSWMSMPTSRLCAWLERDPEERIQTKCRSTRSGDYSANRASRMEHQGSRPSLSAGAAPRRTRGATKTQVPTPSRHLIRRHSTMQWRRRDTKERAMVTTQGMLVELLDLERIEVDILRGRSPDENLQRVFGGQVAGQALVAAGRTVPPDRPVHSLPAYFIRPGDPDLPIVYTVDRIRDGRSFTTRRVVAVQHGRAIFALSASFQVAETGPEYQSLMPEAPDPETVPVWQERLKEYGDQVPARWLRPRPVEVRYVGDPPWQAQAGGGPREPRTMVWLRASETLPDDPLLHMCAVTYASDQTLLDAVLLGSGLAWDEHSVTGASLDYAMWSTGRSAPTSGLLYLQESPAASGARGLARGQVFRRDGRLVASVVQEGLIRVSSPE